MMYVEINETNKIKRSIIIVAVIIAKYCEM